MDRRWLSMLIALCGCAGQAPMPPVDTSCLGSFSETSFGRVSREVIEANLELAPKDDAMRATTVERLFREAGCEVELELFSDSKPPNVICRISGTGSQRIVVGAHHDKVDVGDGVADNWSGAALLPSLYASLATRQRLHTIELIAFGSEEDGLVGSTAHLKALDDTQRASIAAMVNLDTLGLGITQVEHRGSDPKLLCFMIGGARTLASPFELTNVDRVGTSDFLPFRNAGIPVLSVHSISQKTLGILHTRRDVLAAINRDAYYDTYKLVAVSLALLANDLPERKPAS